MAGSVFVRTILLLAPESGTPGVSVPGVFSLEKLCASLTGTGYHTRANTLPRAAMLRDVRASFRISPGAPFPFSEIFS